MGERQISAAEFEKLGSVQDQPDGRVAITFWRADGVEIGVVIPASAASELSGALIERSRQDHPADHEQAEREFDRHVHVSSVEELGVKDDKFVLRIAQEDGPGLTFRLGHRMVRRWRDMLTDQIARFEQSQKQ